MTKTQTVTSVETKTVPYEVTTSTVYCETKPIIYWTQSTSLSTCTETNAYTTQSESTGTQTSEVTKTYTTNTPCPETITSTHQSTYTGYTTVSTSSCKPETSCTTTTSAWGYGGGWN